MHACIQTNSTNYTKLNDSKILNSILKCINFTWVDMLMIPQLSHTTYRNKLQYEKWNWPNINESSLWYSLAEMYILILSLSWATAWAETQDLILKCMLKLQNWLKVFRKTNLWWKCSVHTNTLRKVQKLILYNVIIHVTTRNQLYSSWFIYVGSEVWQWLRGVLRYITM